MNLSSLVGVDRLGRVGSGEGAGSTTSSPSTPHHAGRRTTQVGITGSAVSRQAGRLLRLLHDAPYRGV